MAPQYAGRKGKAESKQAAQEHAPRASCTACTTQIPLHICFYRTRSCPGLHKVPETSSSHVAGGLQTEKCSSMMGTWNLHARDLLYWYPQVSSVNF